MGVLLVSKFKSNATHTPTIKQWLIEQVPRIRDQFGNSNHTAVMTVYGAYDACFLMYGGQDAINAVRTRLHSNAREFSATQGVWLREIADLILWPREGVNCEEILGNAGGDSRMTLTFAKLRGFVDTGFEVPHMRDALCDYVEKVVSPTGPGAHTKIGAFNSFGWADAVFIGVHSEVEPLLKTVMSIRGHWTINTSGTYLMMSGTARNDFPDGCEGQVRCSVSSGADYRDVLVSRLSNKPVLEPCRSVIGKHDFVTDFCAPSDLRPLLDRIGRIEDSGGLVIDSNTIVRVSAAADQEVSRFLSEHASPPENLRRPNTGNGMRRHLVAARLQLSRLVRLATEQRLLDPKVAEEAENVAELIDHSSGHPEVLNHFVDIVHSFYHFVSLLRIQLEVLGLKFPPDFEALVRPAATCEPCQPNTPEWCDRRAMLHREVCWALHYFYRGVLHRHRGGLDSIFYPHLGQAVSRSSLHGLLAVCDELVHSVQPVADYWKLEPWPGHISLGERGDARAYRLTVYNIVSIAYLDSFAILRDLGTITAILVHEAGGHFTFDQLTDMCVSRQNEMEGWPNIVRDFGDECIAIGQITQNVMRGDTSMSLQAGQSRIPHGQRLALISEIWSDLYTLRIIGQADHWISIALNLIQDQAMLFDRKQNDSSAARLVATIVAAYWETIIKDVLKGDLPLLQGDVNDVHRTCQHARTIPDDRTDEVADWVTQRLPSTDVYPHLANLIANARRWLSGAGPHRLAALFASVDLIMKVQSALEIEREPGNSADFLKEPAPMDESESDRRRRFRGLLHELWSRTLFTKPNPDGVFHIFDRLLDLSAICRSEQWRLLLRS